MGRQRSAAARQPHMPRAISSKNLLHSPSSLANGVSSNRVMVSRKAVEGGRIREGCATLWAPRWNAVMPDPCFMVQPQRQGTSGVNARGCVARRVSSHPWIRQRWMDENE